MRVPILLVVISICLSTEAIADQMAIDFTFRGTKGCVSLFPNPEIRLTHVPPGAKNVVLTLQGPEQRELGGEEIRLPSNGVIPAGSIRSFAPCNPGVYTYLALVKAKDGGTIATAELKRAFPSE